MADERKGAYSEVEGLKKSKYKIGKDYKRIEIVISLAAALMVMLLFSSSLFSIDIFFLPIIAKPQGDFNHEYYKLFSTLLLVFLYLFISKKNRVNLFKPDLEKLKKLKKIKKLEKIGFFSFKKVNWQIAFINVKRTIYYILSLPYSMISKLIYIPDDLNKSLGIEPAYLNKLEKKFFYQIVEKEDGYLRVEVSDILKDKQKLLACKDNEELENIKRLFKNNKQFEDLFLIIEGYLTKSKLFDTVLKGKEDITKKQYKYFQTYMLRMKKKTINNKKMEKIEEKLEHDVTFSINAISFFIEDKKEKIEKLIKNILIPNLSNTKRKTITKRVLVLFKDIHYRKKILEYIGNSSKKNKESLLKLYEEVFKVLDNFESMEEFKSSLREKNSIKEIQDAIKKYEQVLEIFYEHLRELLLLDFTIVLFRLVISQYMNLPAGTIVSKLKSYDTRMIIEYYKTFSLIEIEDRKNDGRSENFNSDNYVNVFLQFWAMAVDEIDIYQELYFRFNTNENIKPMTEKEAKELIDSIGLKNAEEQTRNQMNNEYNTNYANDIIAKTVKEQNVYNEAVKIQSEKEIKDDVFIENNQEQK